MAARALGPSSPPLPKATAPTFSLAFEVDAITPAGDRHPDSR